MNQFGNRKKRDATPNTPVRPKTIAAVASGGGHWVQLRRMRPAWRGCHAAYVTTEPGYRDELASDRSTAGETRARFFVIPDANRWQKVRLLRQLLAIALILWRIRPDVVISTGAAPGYFAIRIGKLLGARTIWIDSIANSEELSLSGQKAGRHVDLWLTQWEHLAAGPDTQGRPAFRGAVL